jgi:hypothetical protein
MDAILRALARASQADADTYQLKTIIIFCGIGLLASLLYVIAGYDLGAGFF